MAAQPRGTSLVGPLNDGPKLSSVWRWRRVEDHSPLIVTREDAIEEHRVQM
jgi:hypothetical protein